LSAIAVLYSLTEIETETEMFCKMETKYIRESEYMKRNSNINKNDSTTKMVTHSHGSARVFKGDKASQWKRPKFDPSPHQNPLTDLHKN